MIRLTRHIEARKKRTLMGVPSHLREQIVLEAIENSPLSIAVFLRQSWHGPAPPSIPLPPVVRVNRQLRVESLRIILMNRTFNVHSGRGNEKFQAWLGSLDLSAVGMMNGFAAVKHLNFPYVSRFPYQDPNIGANNDVELALRLSNLRSIHIGFHTAEVVNKTALELYWNSRTSSRRCSWSVVK